MECESKAQLKKKKFPLRIPLANVTTFIEEIFSEKRHFLWSEGYYIGFRSWLVLYFLIPYSC